MPWKDLGDTCINFHQLKSPGRSPRAHWATVWFSVLVCKTDTTASDGSRRSTGWRVPLRDNICAIFKVQTPALISTPLMDYSSQGSYSVVSACTRLSAGWLDLPNSTEHPLGFKNSILRVLSSWIYLWALAGTLAEGFQACASISWLRISGALQGQEESAQWHFCCSWKDEVSSPTTGRL